MWFRLFIDLLHLVDGHGRNLVWVDHLLLVHVRRVAEEAPDSASVVAGLQCIGIIDSS